jgi:predicted PhzF superfamily epimerase YddE/YHI9
MKLLCLMMFLTLIVHTALVSAKNSSASPSNAEVYFISPKDGDKVSNEFTIKFGLKNMGVAPAGIVVKNTGHHHLLVDVQQLPSLQEPLPNNSSIRHFGAGQTEVVLDMPRGEHTLQLLLGNHAHVPHEPPVISQKITVTVE